MADVRPLVLGLALTCALGCGGRTVRLGEGEPVSFRFGTPQLASTLDWAVDSGNPTLTDDMLEIYFTARRDRSSTDVWFAQRATADQPFGPAAVVEAVSSDAYETSSAISSDGLTLWFGSDRPGGSGGLDVWVSHRATRSAPWSPPMNLVALNSADHDIPRPVGQHGLVMPMSSAKLTAVNRIPGTYQTYLAPRPNVGAPFETPLAIAELTQTNRAIVDGFLSDDGLALFFSSQPAAAEPADGGRADAASVSDAGRSDASRTLDGGASAALDGSTSAAGAGSADLYVAFRRSTSDPFTILQPLTDLNTSFEERDPWLSPDGKTFYFTSNRDGALSIYTVPVLPR